MEENIRQKEFLFNGEWHTAAEWATIYGVDEEEFLKQLAEHKFDIEYTVQFRGRKRDRMIEYNGKRMNLTQWAKELNIPYYCLRSRFNILHWTVKKAFETPYDGKKKDKSKK